MRVPFFWFMLLAAACASTPPASGIMAGQWSGAAERVPFSWESTGTGHGQMHATLGRGGERFVGQYVRVETGRHDVHVQSVYDNWAAPAWGSLDWNEEGNYGFGETVDVGAFMHEYSGKVVATLFGDKSHSMRCLFTVQDPNRGFLSGGVGTCQVSDKSTVDVQF